MPKRNIQSETEVNSPGSQPATKKVKGEQFLDGLVQNAEDSQKIVIALSLTTTIPTEDSYVWKSCDDIRKEINDFLQQHRTSISKFAKVALGASAATLTKFMKLDGHEAGSGCEVYFKAYDFFERLRLANGIEEPRKSQLIRARAEKNGEINDYTVKYLKRHGRGQKDGLPKLWVGPGATYQEAYQNVLKIWEEKWNPSLSSAEP